jgi:hypothetical protein
MLESMNCLDELFAAIVAGTGTVAALDIFDWGAKPGRTKFLGWQSVIHANHYDFGVMITILDQPLRHYDCLTQNYDF